MSRKEGLSHLLRLSRPPLIPWSLPSIAERFRDMYPRHRLTPRQISNRSSDTEDTGIAARGQPHRFGSLGEQFAARFVRRRDAFEGFAIGFGIGADAIAFIARSLSRSGGSDARGDLR